MSTKPPLRTKDGTVAKRKLREKSEDIWHFAHTDMTKEGIKHSFASGLRFGFGRDSYTVTAHDDFLALAIAIRDRLVERWIETQQRYHELNAKRVYYLSLEFLIGRLLGNNIMNLGLWEETKSALQELGLDIESLRNEESDAG